MLKRSKGYKKHSILYSTVYYKIELNQVLECLKLFEFVCLLVLGLNGAVFEIAVKRHHDLIICFIFLHGFPGLPFSFSLYVLSFSIFPFMFHFIHFIC